MNTVALIGNLTRDPEVRYTNDQMAIATFAIAINRPPKKDGSDGGADFPKIICFGKTAENCERFLSKGKKIAVVGKIQTGSYEKDGQRFYTTEVVADRIEFLSQKSETQNEEANIRNATQNATSPTPSKAFEEIDDDDIPF